MRKHVLLFCFLLLKSGMVIAQLPAKLYASDSFKMFNGSSMSVWGNFYNTANSASGGSLVIDLNSSLIMYGDTFQNNGATKIGGSGNFEMQRPRPAPYASSSKQVLISGGSSVSFPTLKVNTTSTIDILGYDLRIRDSLKFSSGHIVLNNYDLIIGEGAPGVVTGYSQNSFIVTNGNTVDTLKGYLIREQVGATATVFPVGQDVGDYTPVILTNNGTTDHFKVRVFDTVYEDGYTLMSSGPVSANDRSVQRTWDIREGTTGGSNVNMTLQYNTSTESSNFSSNRSKAFISHYTGVNPNYGGDTISNWKWDNFTLSSTSTPVSPGTVTTNGSIAGASMKSRNGVTSFSPFTITTWATGAVPLPIHIVKFSAKWNNPEDALIEWELTDIDKVSIIVLERSFDGNSFSALKSFGNLNSSSSFRFIDAGVYDQTSSMVFYRLKIIEKAGNVVLSDKQMLKKNPGTVSVVRAYPNPAQTSVQVQFININSGSSIIVLLYNMSGQVVYEKKINESLKTSFSDSINISKLESGIYYLKISGEDISYAEKLVIRH